MEILTKEEYRDKFLMLYNQMGFLAPIMINIIDQLQETHHANKKYKQSLKFNLNQALPELEKINAEHAIYYENHGDVDNNGQKLDARYVYKITSEGYDKVMEMLKNDSPNIIASKMHLLETYDNRKFDWQSVDIPIEEMLL